MYFGLEHGLRHGRIQAEANRETERRPVGGVQDLTALFLEVRFLGVMLFGMNRVGQVQ